MAAEQRRQDRRRRRQLRVVHRPQADVPRVRGRATCCAKEAVYLIDFNVDGWAVGDFWNRAGRPPRTRAATRSAPTSTARCRRSAASTTSRNPLAGERDAVRAPSSCTRSPSAGQDGKMAYGADIHGEMNSQAYMDIMYPAGEFDSVDHRRLMAIAERTKSVIDATLYEGIVEEIENATGGNDAEYPTRDPDSSPRTGRRSGTRSATPTPASSATTWPPTSASPGWTTRSCSTTRSRRRPGTSTSRRTTSTPRRGIIKTAMAYALFQEQEFNATNVRVDTDRPRRLRRQPGHGHRHGRERAGHAARARGRTAIGEDGKPVEQRPTT